MRKSTIKIAILGIAMLAGLFLRANDAHAGKLETAVFAGGCFWCIEADFESVKGVKDVVSGYTGGRTKNPTYKAVSNGGTGHYEAVKITYNPMQVSYDELLRLFFRSVDPTDAGGQFCDRGDSYRTAIFVTNAAQRDAAVRAKAAAAKELGKKIVTPIETAGTFYLAEDRHQNYYKGKSIVLTRSGPKKQSAAYKFYRKGCKRDQRVSELWGSQAPFVGN